MPPSVRSSVQKKQRQSYSGKKKRHTQKAQLVADQKTKRILATAFSEGKLHDFKLHDFKLLGKSCLARAAWRCCPRPGALRTAAIRD